MRTLAPDRRRSQYKLVGGRLWDGALTRERGCVLDAEAYEIAPYPWNPRLLRPLLIFSNRCSLYETGVAGLNQMDTVSATRRSYRRMSVCVWGMVEVRRNGSGEKSFSQGC